MLLVVSGSLLKGLGLDRVRLPRLDLGAGMGRAPPPTQQAGERKQYEQGCRHGCYVNRGLVTVHCLRSRRVGMGVCEKHRRRDCEDDRAADLKRAADESRRKPLFLIADAAQRLDVQVGPSEAEAARGIRTQVPRLE